MPSFFRLLRTIRLLFVVGQNHRRTLMAAWACMVAVALGQGVYAYFMGPVLAMLLTGQKSRSSSAIDSALAHWTSSHSWQPEWLLLGIVVIAGAIKGMGYLGQFYCSGLYGQRVAEILRRRVFVEFLKLSPVSTRRDRTGSLLSLLSHDVAQVELAATYTLSSWVRDSMQLLVLLSVAAWKAPLATLGVFIVAPILLWPASRLSRLFLKRISLAQTGIGQLAGAVAEGVQSIPTLQAYEAQSAHQVKFEQQSKTVARLLTKAAWSRAWTPALVEMVSVIAAVSLLAWVVQKINMPFEAALSFLFALLAMAQPAKDIGRTTQYALQAQASMEHMQQVLGVDILQTASKINDERERQEKIGRHSLKIKDLSVGYGKDAVLKHIDLDLKPGTTLAIIGPSGGGKSTLVRALLGQMPLLGGAVFWGDEEISKATSAERLALFAYVPQEPLVFSSSVADNLRLARPGILDSEMWDALDSVNLKVHVESLPSGLHTPLGERGVLWSGGQKQRLAIARALLSKAPIMLLDEPTSQLDYKTEVEVVAVLHKVLKNRTALWISHRPSSIEQCDRTVMIEHGRVIEQEARGCSVPFT